VLVFPPAPPPLLVLVVMVVVVAMPLLVMAVEVVIAAVVPLGLAILLPWSQLALGITTVSAEQLDRLLLDLRSIRNIISRDGMQILFGDDGGGGDPQIVSGGVRTPTRHQRNMDEII
jgi:hypothetical protein